MKITNKQLKQIIKEELEHVLEEFDNPFRKTKEDIPKMRNEAVQIAMNTYRQIQPYLDKISPGYKSEEIFKPGNPHNIFKGELAVSPGAKKIKNDLKKAFKKTIKEEDGIGLSFGQAIQIWEAAAREVGLPTKDVIDFLKKIKHVDKKGRKSSVTVDDPTMQ